jgi:hypothetical protein
MGCRINLRDFVTKVYIYVKILGYYEKMIGMD